MYIYLEYGEWKLAEKITDELEEFCPSEIEFPERGVGDLLEFAEEIGIEEGDIIKNFFDSRYNDSYFIGEFGKWTILASGGNYSAYETEKIPKVYKK